VVVDSIFQGGLVIEENSRLTIAASPTITVRIVVNTLDLEGSGDSLGTLDVNNSGMIVKDGDYDVLVAYIRQAMDPETGLWDGKGITSSVAANDPTYLTSLGIATGGEFLLYSPVSPIFLGMTVTNADWILVRVTTLGDSDMDGALTMNDYNLLVSAFEANNDSDPNNDVPATWTFGDYDYDRVLTGSDYSCFVYAWNMQH
jgi:hypothetical protein